jgi:hypothetical protein
MYFIFQSVEAERLDRERLVRKIGGGCSLLLDLIFVQRAHEVVPFEDIRGREHSSGHGRSTDARGGPDKKRKEIDGGSRMKGPARSSHLPRP